MYRFRALLLLAALAILFVPAVSFAAGLPLLDPNWHIVPDPHELDETCAPGSPLGIGAVVVLLQNLMNAAVSLTVIVMTLVIAYAGFLFLTSPFNSENRSKAKTTLWNTVVGVFLVLSAWLIMDFAMKILYNPEATFGGKAIGPWNEVLVGGDACIRQGETGPLFGSIPFSPDGGPQVDSGVGAGGTGAGTSVPTPATRGVCTPAGLQKAGWPTNLANKMSCVTKYENASCNASAPSGTDIGADGRSVSIGLFQVNISAHDMNYPACTALNNGQPLNCTRAFSGGAYTASNHATRVRDQRLYTICRAVASNPSCNTAAAYEIYKKQGIGAWGTRAQNACRSL